MPSATLALPQHVAIIMDGNGRWAKQRNLMRHRGHMEGAEALRRTIHACLEIGIHYLTVYVFSTENWSRPEVEINFLMKLMASLIKQELPSFIKNEIKMQCLGDLNPLPRSLQTQIRTAEEKTKSFSKLTLNLLVNYGGRAEILKAVQDLISQNKNANDVSLENFSRFLYTNSMPDPEILIRTGGDYRISNFLLWQSAYTEFFFLDTFWPDFNKETLVSVVDSYQKRERRFGGLAPC